MIFKWWLPQIIEILAIIQANHDRYDLTILIQLFRHSSINAIFLLCGEYLVVEESFSIPSSSTNNDDLKIQSDKIKIQCKDYTKSLREILNLHKNLHSNNSFSYIKNRRNEFARQNSSATSSSLSLKFSHSRTDLNREYSFNSWSQSSVTDFTTSPRGWNATDSAFLDEDEMVKTNFLFSLIFSSFFNSPPSLF